MQGMQWIRATGLLVTIFGALSCSESEQTKTEGGPGIADSETLLEERLQFDQTVWAAEVTAQRYEAVFVSLWDRIRNADPAGKFALLASFPFTGEISLGTPDSPQTVELEINLTSFNPEPARTFSPPQWGEFVRSFQQAGIKIVQTEWHHSRFVPAGAAGPKSIISFTIHAVRAATRTTFAVQGDLEVQWAPAISGGASASPVAESITIAGLTLQDRSAGGLFRKLLTAQNDPGQFASAHPVLVYDLDGDGFSEIVLPRWNHVYWNRGGRKFEKGEFLAHPRPFWETGILSDFDGDGAADFVTVGKDGAPYFYQGSEDGKFPSKPRRCAGVKFDLPSAITAGDVDGDGDLDLWMTQYKLSFHDGQMPTPFYNANDGYPSYFLRNDGSGQFEDATDAVGLSPLRSRRSYSASFVDLDEDGDLDLLNVSDYAGLDLYENRGDGTFILATDRFVDERHFFGMGHTLGDYNGDGRLDFYVIGMSSTTARRLDRLNLGRKDRPEVHRMRAEMGYGNRLYFGSKTKRFREDPAVAPVVARTGWSWGATSFDFDLDGDLDIYIANGHRSGKSCQDYCTTFWRHDIYTGDSMERPEIVKLFQSTLRDVNRKVISWNGYEKNVLFINEHTKPSRFVNGAFLFGTAYSFDGRSVVSDDLDGDGRPDLIVAESIFDGRGFALSVHAFANEIVTAQPHNWLTIRLRESAAPGFSPNGAKVTITDEFGDAQTRWIVTGDSFLAQHAPTAHFGLGKAKRVQSVQVTWPNGNTEEYDLGSKINTTVTLRGGLGAAD
jgi:hypothetical protein